MIKATTNLHIISAILAALASGQLAAQSNWEQSAETIVAQKEPFELRSLDTGEAKFHPRRRIFDEVHH